MIQGIYTRLQEVSFGWSSYMMAALTCLMDWVGDPWYHTAVEAFFTTWWPTIYPNGHISRLHPNGNIRILELRLPDYTHDSVDCQTIHTMLVILGIFPKKYRQRTYFSRHIPDKIGNFPFFTENLPWSKCIYWYTSTFKQNLVILVILVID